MRYLVGTESDIKAKNHQEAMARGCSPTGVTWEWYAVRKTNTGLSVLMINDDKNIAGSVTVEPVWEVVSTL